MEPTGVQVAQGKLVCAICLNLLKDPVTIPCEHSYCRTCIQDLWNRDQRGIYSCPRCKKEFISTPVVEKSGTLTPLGEDLINTELQASPTNNSFAGPKEESPAFEKHKVVDPSRNLQENNCSCQHEMKKIFCRTDQQCICYLCLSGQHKDHETVPITTERTEKQRKLRESQQQLKQRIKEQDKEVKLLQQEVETINVSADRAVEDNEKIISGIIHLLRRRRYDVTQQIRSQQETEVSRIKELQKKLEQEITELKRKYAKLQQYSNTEDHAQFLQNYPSLSALSVSTYPTINIRPQINFEDVTAAVLELKDILEDILRDTWTNISLKLTDEDVLMSKPEPRTRPGFLKYSQEITLDPNTVNRYMLLSEENTKVTTTKEQQSYPNHPDRFINYNQVLNRESLTGRCYWEVKWRGGVVVAVSYKNIRRDGKSEKSLFLYNDKSWSLYCYKNCCAFYQNKLPTTVPGPISSTLGVYLDHRAGILSFYSVSKTMTLLRRVQTTFTQPLHAGIWLFEGSSAEFVKLKKPI
ncbi:PREDICTED: tripartite motif-containing protein 16-like protein [Cyprinodon variegatus]|uniref:tripartite motif-containing protein 16-like protein n=1 Tax=Cyprinodon variegatus TaxID=28743 RepID=UPI000742BC07|nr:PREDICTED: tripartite motif-containing protein 16-like protein [Cyprinodon variegatus]